MAEDQMIRVLSREAEANRVPSLENLTQETARWWAARVLRWRKGLYGWLLALLLLVLVAIILTFCLSVFLDSKVDR